MAQLDSSGTMHAQTLFSSAGATEAVGGGEDSFFSSTSSSSTLFAKVYFTLPGGFQLNARRYFVLVIFLGVLTFYFGILLIDHLRFCCRTYKKVYRLAAVVFITPCCVFLTLNILLAFGLAERMLCDALSFCLAMGILLRLTNKPTGPNSVKIVAQEGSGRSVDVWFDNKDMLVGDVRSKIAEALLVSPANRVSIESGKGSFIEDLNKPFLGTVDEGLITTDFFGFMTMPCFIVVKEDDRKRLGMDENSSERITLDRRNSSVGGQLFTLLQKTEVRYNELYTLTARLTCSSESKTTFLIAAVDRFAAAAPSSHLHLNAHSVRFHVWKGETEPVGQASDLHSEGGDSHSNSSVVRVNSVGHRASPILTRAFRKRFGKKDDESSGKSLSHGDVVVLEAGGKYMSVTRGWWMSWSSSEPRRSGAFTVEILEKAPQNKLKEHFDNIKEKIRPHHNNGAANNANADHVLRVGDVFRLRSVKFPEFELGLTSVKLRDDYCYLGMRKIITPLDSTEDNWCMEMRFTLKA